MSVKDGRPKCIIKRKEGRKNKSPANYRQGSVGRKYPEYKKSTYESQGKKCAICFRDLVFEEARLDHCHITGTLRGVLCNRCNVALGGFQDNEALLDAAAEYLRKHR
jgi:hypothetical protein